jgi:positive regulator of sigma E activity
MISYAVGLIVYSTSALACMLGLMVLIRGYYRKEMILQPNFVVIIVLLLWGSLGFVIINIASYKINSHIDDQNKALFILGCFGKFS